MDFYGTIGPACADVKLLQQMVEAGMTGIRMNLSHGPLAAHKDWLVMLHKAGVKKLLIDLQGPELRIGRLPQPLSLTAGQTVRLGAQGIPCPTALVQGVQPGQELLLDDGKLLARVDTAEPEALVCTVVRGGVLQSRKSLAAPGADIQMPTLTTEDKENLAIAAGCGVTGVMLPFVRGAADIRNLRQALAEAGAPGLKILAKIENLAGVQALPEFLPLVDEVVIARGDLGNAMPLWELPCCQKQLSCRLPGSRGTLYGGDPDAGQHAHPGCTHPRRGERHLQRRTGRRIQPDAHRRDRRRAVPGAGHGVSGAHRPHGDVTGADSECPPLRSGHYQRKNYFLFGLPKSLRTFRKPFFTERGRDREIFFRKRIASFVCFLYNTGKNN